MQITTSPIMQYDTISIPFASGSNSTKLPFPDQPYLRNAKAKAIELVYSNYDFNGQLNVNYNANVISNSFITLYFDGMEGIQRMPIAEIATIIQSTTSGTSGSFNINGLIELSEANIVWTKSYIELAIPQPPSSNTNYVLGIYFRL